MSRAKAPTNASLPADKYSNWLFKLAVEPEDTFGAVILYIKKEFNDNVNGGEYYHKLPS